MATIEAPVRPRTLSQSHSGPFVNEPFYDFRHEENARKMRAAIERVRGQLGREYDLIIGGNGVWPTHVLLQRPDGRFLHIDSLPGKEHPSKFAKDEGLLLFDANSMKHRHHLNASIRQI